MNKNIAIRKSSVGGGNPSDSQRIIGLDILRISLALLVFSFHSHTHVLKCDYGWLNGFVNMGAIAMTGFFLLSGYAMNLSYGRKKMTNIEDIKSFYIKRLIAILPLYYVYALINVGIIIAMKGLRGGIQELMLFPIEALGLQSVFASLFSFSHNGGSWFISCILICYFLYPLLHTLTMELNNRSNLVIIITLCVILLWSPIIAHYFRCQTIYSNPFFRSLEFCLGILVCQLNVKLGINCKLIRFLRTPMACIVSVFLLVIGVSIAQLIGIPGDYMLYNWIALPCFISLLISLGSMPLSKLNNSSIISYLSKLSFSIFLSQILVVWSVVRFAMQFIGLDSNIANILVSAFICFCIANFLHFCIEIPSSKVLKAIFLKNK